MTPSGAFVSADLLYGRSSGKRRQNVFIFSTFNILSLRMPETSLRN